MSDPVLIDTWLEEERAQFQGWDFSYLNDRMVQDEPPWDYLDLERDAMGSSQSMLDMARFPCFHGRRRTGVFPP